MQGLCPVPGARQAEEPSGAGLRTSAGWGRALPFWVLQNTSPQASNLEVNRLENGPLNTGSEAKRTGPRTGRETTDCVHGSVCCKRDARGRGEQVVPGASPPPAARTPRPGSALHFQSVPLLEADETAGRGHCVDAQGGPLPARPPSAACGATAQGGNKKKGENTPHQRDHRKATHRHANTTTQQLKWDEEGEGWGGKCKKQGTK